MMGIMLASWSGVHPRPPQALTLATLQYLRHTVAVPLLMHAKVGWHWAFEVHGEFLAPVPAVSQKVKLRIAPVCSWPKSHPVPVGQPVPLTTLQLPVQSLTLGMDPMAVPSLSWRAQMPPALAQSASVLQKRVQIPTHSVPGAHWVGAEQAWPCWVEPDV